MALTQSAWTVKTVNNKAVYTCTVTATTAENDAYTLPTPPAIDTAKPYSLTIVCSATPDGQALPFEIYIGTGPNFLMTGDGATIGATQGVRFKQIFDDIVLAVTPLGYTFLIDPNLPVADVVTVAAIATGPKVRVPSGTAHAFNQNGGSTLAAATTTYTIVQ